LPGKSSKELVSTLIDLVDAEGRMWCVVRVAARVGDLVGSMAIIAVLQQTQASMVIGCYLLCGVVAD
jgi:hypothetical protein